ncbi:M1 family metallopeptidase [Gulosibacter bifidus]|uniref:Aminopeptidase N n=1 Tax=Gulosibacter bifidus TaxID=272239 RepID=A0ABW5RGQ2_9MICO|nr:M1 family metallopeptidase [Gulosibacter bifidus]
MHTPDPYLPGHGDLRYHVRHYDLDLQYKIVTNRLDEVAKLHIEIARPTSRIDVDLVGLNVSKVLLDGTPARHRRKPNGISVEVGERLVGERFVLELRVAGKPGPMPGVHGEAGWEELTDGAMVGSQPQGAPSWFPCNNDAGDKATYRIRVTCAAGYTVIANGTLTSRTTTGGNIAWVYEMNEPMSPYLATVQIGKYRESYRDAIVPVSIVHPPRVPVGPGTAFAKQADMVDFFVGCYGNYPFNEYRAVIVDDELEIPLEAQGLSSFGRNFVTPDWNNERLVAHELAHQWFGNCVTSKQLHDMWLHEGFACYSEWLWSDYSRRWHRMRPGVQQRAAEHYAKLPPMPAGATLADPGMKHLFDDWVYKRGALTLHALRVACGDSLFFDILQAWVAENAGSTITTEQFVDHCRVMAGDDGERIEALLRAWLYAPELPPLPVYAG